jgi:sugar lactone lactonase YvrE
MLAVFAVLPSLAQGPNITYTFNTEIKNGLNFATSVAVDSAGNVFVADIGAGALDKETLNSDGSYTQSTISTGASSPVAVAIDSSGNLYVADGAHNVYKETLSGSSYTESTVASTFTSAYRLAVDGAGDVYVLDAGSGSVSVEKLSGSTYTQSSVTGGLNVPNDGSGGGGIAVDSAGNVYIADTGNSRVLKETLSSGTYTQSVVMDSSTYQDNAHVVPPQGIAVDTAGAVIIVNENYGVFKAVPNGATYTTTPIVFSGTSATIAGVSASIDLHGNLYIVNLGQIYVNPANELAESSSAENFGSLNVGATAAPQTATFTFDVGGTLATIPYAVSTQGDLTLDFQAAATQPANVCVTGKTYNAGDTCTVAATFTPTRPGVRYGAIALFAPSGTPIATSYVQGIGVSPQVSFSPGSPAIEGQTFAVSVTVDSSSDVVYSATGVGLVLRSFTGAHPLDIVTPSFMTGYTGSNNYSNDYGTSFGNGYVVDGAGNIVFADGFTSATTTLGVTSFSADDVNPTIAVPQTSTLQVNATNYGTAFLASVPFTSTSITPPSNNRPAVDGAGNLYFADDSGGRILEEQYIHGAYNKLLVVATGLNDPGDVVVDAAGAVYAADTGNNRIVKETPTGDGTYTQTIVDSGFATPPEGLAIDRIGNLYVALFNNFLNSNVPFLLKETLADGTYTRSTLTMQGSEGLDVDAAGDIFAAVPASTSNTFISDIDSLDVATPPSFIFAQTAVGSTSTDSPQTVTIVNNGNAPLTFSGTPTITAGFTLSPSSTCPQATIAPQANCAFNINFVPTQSGTNNGTLTITDNHLGTPGATQIIKLSGQGTGQSQGPVLTPTSMDFGNVPIETVSSSQTATLQNNGTTSLPLAFSVTGHNPGGFGYTDNCGLRLAAGASCSIAINCDPVIVETLTATFVAEFVGTGTQQGISLTCNGTAAAGGPQPVLTPATLNFGSLPVGTTSTAKTATLSNTGGVPQGISSFGFFGPNTSSFSQTNNCGISLAAGASCTISITCTPSASGALGANLGVNFPSPEPQESVALSCTGAVAAAPQATLTPASADFGSLASGTTSPAQTFTLSNPGNATLSISGITLAGTNASDFAIATNTCGESLAASASCSIAITFTPSATGSFSATLSVADNAAGSPQTSALTGTGTVPADFTIAASPSTQSVSSGATAAYSVSVTSADGSFTNPVVLTATGLPPGATVTFSPASVTPGSSAAQSSMSIQTARQQASAKDSHPRWPFEAPVVAALLLLVPGKRWRSRRRWMNLACFAALLGLATSTIGCGGGFALPSTATTYTITVTGTSGSDTHSTTVTLTVQ